jgi:hypothetical protein
MEAMTEEELKYLKALYDAAKHISDKTGEQDLTKISVPIDYIMAYMKEEELR